MKMATVKHTKIYKLYIIVSYYFMLFPEKSNWKVPLYFWVSADIAWNKNK